MKITPEHFDRLRAVIHEGMTRIPALALYEARDPSVPRIALAKDPAKRYRWDALYAAPLTARQPLIDAIYEYADDSHIDTALKKIVAEMGSIKRNPDNAPPAAMKRALRAKKIVATLTANQLRNWLLDNDQEGAELWDGLESLDDLRDAVIDNLRDFGMSADDVRALRASPTERIRMFRVVDRAGNAVYAGTNAYPLAEARRRARDSHKVGVPGAVVEALRSPSQKKRNPSRSFRAGKGKRIDSRVSFGQFPDTGEVIAFLWDLEASPGRIVDFLHVGQHGEADLAFALDLPPADAENAAKLLRELTDRVGYTLTVVNHPPKFAIKRNPIGKHRTTIRPTESGAIEVTYHATVVARRNADGTVTLNSGGYKTATTKKRINQALDEWGCDFGVGQHKGVWWIIPHGLPFRRIMKFADGMTLSPAGGLVNYGEGPKRNPDDLSDRAKRGLAFARDARRRRREEDEARSAARADRAFALAREHRKKRNPMRLGNRPGPKLYAIAFRPAKANKRRRFAFQYLVSVGPAVIDPSPDRAMRFTSKKDAANYVRAHKLDAIASANALRAEVTEIRDL